MEIRDETLELRQQSVDINAGFVLFFSTCGKKCPLKAKSASINYQKMLIFENLNVQLSKCQIIDSKSKNCPTENNVRKMLMNIREWAFKN